MFNNINELADHRRFIRWLATGKQAPILRGGVGGPCQVGEKNGSAPLFSSTQLSAEQLALSNALAIKRLPSLTSLPKSRNHDPISASSDRLAKLWAEWQSNAHAICNSVYIRGSRIEAWAKLQFELTQQIMSEFKVYERHYC